MSTKVIQFKYKPSLTTLSINVYPLSGGTYLNLSGPVEAIADPATPALYQCIVTDLITTGTYNVDILDGDIIRGSFLCDIDDIDGFYPVCDGATPYQLAAQVSEVINRPLAPNISPIRMV